MKANYEELEQRGCSNEYLGLNLGGISKVIIFDFSPFGSMNVDKIMAKKKKKK